MIFDEFRNTYFGGDSENALRTLVNEAINNEYKLTGSKTKHKEILDSLDTTLANTYAEYQYEAYEIMYTEENVSHDIKNKILSLNVIEYKLNRSVYSTKGMKYMLPVSLALIILFWMLLGHKGILEFLTTGIIFTPFIILVLCYARISTKVTNLIKNRDFYIVEDVVVDKIYKPGNAEDLPKYFFVFQNHGKYCLAPDEEKLFDVAKNGHLCYLLLPTNGKKIRFIFDSQIWKICEKDFQFNNGVYSPRK